MAKSKSKSGGKHGGRKTGTFPRKNGKRGGRNYQKPIKPIVGKGLFDGAALRFRQISKIQIMRAIVKYSDKLEKAGKLVNFTSTDKEAINQIRSMIKDAAKDGDYKIDVAEAYKIAQLSLPVLRKLFIALKQIKSGKF